MSAKPDELETAVYYLAMLIRIVEAIRDANIKALTQEAAANWMQYNRIRKSLLTWEDKQDERR